MDFKNILEGARPFFQGLPQPLGQSSPATSETVSSNAKEKDPAGNHSVSHNNHHHQAYHASVITNHSSNSGLNRNGSNAAALPYSSSSASHPVSSENASDGSMNNNNNSTNNNNNTKRDKDPSGGSVVRKSSHSVNSVSPSVVSQQQNLSNTSGKSGSASGTPSHPLLQGGFANNNPLTHTQRSSSSSSSSGQSHVPIHVPLTIPLPNHHQERPISRPKYEEGLGATLSQMYAGTLAGSRGSSQGRHMNGAPAGLLQTAPPINTNHGVGSGSNVNAVGGGVSGSAGSSVGAVSKNMGGTSVRRESPLDLSVKTVRQSADSSTPLEIPTPSSGMNGSVGGSGARSLAGSGASTPNMLMQTMSQLHYPLHSLSEGHSSVTSASGRQIAAGETMNSVIAAAANSTTGVGLSSNESRSSSGKSGRGRSREKSHERENSSSRSRTSTPTGSNGAMRYPSPAHLHRQQSPSGTASPHLHQRVSSLQLNIPNPTPPPRTASGSSAGGYNPSGTPQTLHPSPAATPGAPTTPHHMYSQHSYAPSPIPPGASSTGKGIPQGVTSYHSHYPGIPPPSHHPPQTNSSSSGSQHSNGVPAPTSAVPTGSSPAPTAVSSGSHHSQQSKHSSTIAPYNPTPPSFGPSLNSGYLPPSAHHHQSAYQYHQYPPPHHAPPPSHAVPPQSHPPPLSHHPHHPYYSSVYGHHSHLQQPPPPVGAPHQRSTSSVPPTSSANTSSSVPHGSGASQSPAPSGSSSTPTPSAAHASQYLPNKHAGYAYAPPAQTQSSQPQQSSQVATTHAYYHGNPPASSYYSAPHQTQPPHVTASNQIPAQQQSRPPSTSNQHHPVSVPGYPSSHYGHSQAPAASAAPYSHTPQHLYPNNTPLNYPTYVPQAQRTQAANYPPVQQQGYPGQPPYYQGPPGLRPSTPTAPPHSQQPPASYPTAPPPSNHAGSTTSSAVPTGKGSPSSAEASASDMKPPQNPSTSGKSPKSGNSRKNLLHMLRHSVENRMNEKQDKDKFQFNHQTWNFHGKKYNTTIPQINNTSSSSQIPASGVASPGGPNYTSRPGSPSGSSSFSVDTLKTSSGQQSSKYDSGSSSYGGGSSSASSTYGTNASSESSNTSGIGSLSDSSHYNRIRTKAEKKQLFPNLLSQIEQENSHKEAEKLLQQQQQQYIPSGNYYAHPATAVGSGQNMKSGTSANALNSSFSKNKLTNSTSVFDFRDDEDDSAGPKGVPQVPPPTTLTTTPTTATAITATLPIAVPEGKPPKKPRSPKKATEPGARRNSLPKASKGDKPPKKVKQTPQQQQELMAAVIASVAAASSNHAAAAEAHQKYIESLRNKSSTPLTSPVSKEPSTLATPLRIPNPSAIAREIAPPVVAQISTEVDSLVKGTTPAAAPSTNTTTSSSSSSTTTIKVEAKPAGGTSSSSATGKTAVASTALESMDAFWDVCDSFLDDLKSNPVSIKSRRGGLWQKLKGKAKPKATDGNNVDVSVPGKVRKGRAGPRIKKNSSEEDSDFEVEKSSEEDDEEEEEEDESDQSDKSDSDESNSVSGASRKGSNSGESSGIQRGSRKGVVVKKKKKRVIESEDEDEESDREEKIVKTSGDDKSRKGRNGSRSLSSKKRSVSKATSKTESSDVGSSRRGSKKQGKGETVRSRSGGRGRTKESTRRSVRKRKTVLGKKSGIASLSDLDEDEDATSRTSIGSESDASEESDSEVSSFDDSSMSGDSDSNGLSGDSDSDEDSDGQSFTSSRKRKKSLTTGGKKAKRARLSKSKKREGKNRKSRKSGKNKAGTKRTRSASTKNGKRESRSTSTNGKKDKENIQDSEFSDDSSVDIKKSRSLRSRSRGQKQGGARKLRPKRNCAPTPGNGKLKDISETDEEDEERGGSSGEEWIMRTELGKKKRRIVFGDGSEFQRPGWEEELIDFKKKQLRMPHKLIRVAKPSSLSLSPSGNGAQSTASSVTGGITESGGSPAKSTKENKSPCTPAKGSKQQRQRDKSPEKDIPDLIREKPVEKETKEKKTKGRSSKAAASAPVSATSTPSKADAPPPLTKEKSKKEKEPAPATTADKPTKGKGKGAKSKVVVEKKPDISESSLDEPAIGRAVEQMNAAAKRDSKSGSSNNVSASVKATIDAVVKSSEKKDDHNVSSESKSKKGSAASKANSASATTPAVVGAGNTSNSETLPLPNAEVPSPSSSTSAATTTTPVAKKTLRRNKFKSGFDYIRKKKKATAPDGSAAAPPPKRVKSAAEKNTNVEDIQAEVRSWVLNKGLGETALHRAARLGYPDVAAWCLDSDNCQPNCKDNAGYTPLHETCIKGNLEVAKVLLRYGANPSQAAPGGIRPLHEACENGHVELVRLLISYGADPTVATYAGQTPLELAENHEPVRLLLQQHINDVQGRKDNYWEFRGSGNWSEEPFDNGYSVTDDPPLAEPDVDDMDGFEFECSEMPLPTLYRLKDPSAHYVLLNEVLSYLGQPRDRVLEKLPGVEIVELNSNDFLEQAHCCHLLGEKFNFNAISELTLVKYDDRMKRMLGVETCRIK